MDKRLTDEELARISLAPFVGHESEFYDLWIGRARPDRNEKASIWMNPYAISQFGKEGSIEHFQAYLRQRDDLLAKIPSLRGKMLGCTCRMSDDTNGPMCHGDEIVRAYLDWARSMVELHGVGYFLKGKT